MSHRSPDRRREARVRALILALPLLLALPSACGGRPEAIDERRPSLLVSDRSGALRIYEESGDGGARLLGRRGLGDRSTRDIMPARLPDGRIVFVSDRDGNPEIYIAASDGEARRLTVDPPDRPAVDSGPEPLGTDRIVFARTAPGEPDAPAGTRDLFVLRLDGTGEKRLTHHPADDWAPSASADGRSVVFVSDRTGTPRIHMIPDVEAADLEASTVCLSDFELPRTSPGPGGRASADGAPAFLPDGSIVFSRTPFEGVPHLYVMGGRGARDGLRQITESLTLPFGAAEPVVLDARTLLFTTGPIVDRGRPGSPARFAVYRIALGGFNLTRVTRSQAPYADFARHLDDR
ncbi:MAG TPA: hypothetical protein VGV60_09385 [Candidatus Polarisedimenticolia bacterium]|nr:hypothetical protein [Candidatus Polarisedimenticolia bacterium]